MKTIMKKCLRLQGLFVSLLIAISTILYWIFIEYWWHYFFLIGYIGIGYFITSYFLNKKRYD